MNLWLYSRNLVSIFFNPVSNKTELWVEYCSNVRNIYLLSNQHPIYHYVKKDMQIHINTATRYEFMVVFSQLSVYFL
jgi:hypothetical protein